MTLVQIKTFAVRPNATVREKITHVRKQIKVREIIHTCKPTSYKITDAVYYDQMEELHATLFDLKLKESQIDPLEQWCESHPSDLECRIYE